MSRKIGYNTDREWENYIQEFRLDRGLSLNDLAVKSKVSFNTVCRLISGYISPIYQLNTKRGKKGEVKPWVERICITLNVQPEVMFPREICPLENPKIKGFHKTQIDEMSLSEHCLRSRHDVFSNYFSSRKFIWRYITNLLWFKKLPATGNCHPRMYKRWVQVLQMRFLCDMTLGEVSLKLNITRERVRQIEKKALWCLRKSDLIDHIIEDVVKEY